MKSRHALINLGLIGLVFLLTCFVIGKLISAPSQDISSEETDLPTARGNIVELARRPDTSSKTGSDQTEHQPIVVKDAVICLNIRNQKPVGIVSQITSNVGRIYCWARVVNGQGQKIRYIWHFNRKPSFSQWQMIIAPRYQTWCGHTINPGVRGKCYVEIVNQTGQVLARVDFKIIPQSSRGRIKHL